MWLFFIATFAAMFFNGAGVAARRTLGQRLCTLQMSVLRLFGITRGRVRSDFRTSAEAVGILSGSLFHHFASKDQMLLETMREAFLTVSIGLEKILTEERDPSVQLREMIRLELDAIVRDERKDFHAVLYFDWCEAPAADLPELNRDRKRYKRCWTQAIEACSAAGRLRCDADIGEQVIYGTMRHAMTWFNKRRRHTARQFSAKLA